MMPTTVKKEIKKEHLEAAITFTDPASDELTFTHAIFAQCTLPYRRPKVTSWVVKHGNVSLAVDAGRIADDKSGELKRLDVPYGSYARLVFCHIHNQIIRSSCLDSACSVDLGDSMREFFRMNGINNIGGKQAKTIRDQLLNIGQANITFGFFADNHTKTKNMPRVADEIDFWISKDDSQLSLWEPVMKVAEDYARFIRTRSFPLDLRAVILLRGSSRAIDTYHWLAYRLPTISNPKGVFIPYEGVNGLHSIFGKDVSSNRKFKQEFVKAVKDVLEVYPKARVKFEERGLRCFESETAVPRSISYIGSRLCLP